MRNARLDGLQTGIKIGRKNIKNLRYADDITLLEESEEKLRDRLMKVNKESERASLRLRLKKKIKNMVSAPIIAWQIEGENVVGIDALFWGCKITADCECSHET